MRRVVVTGASGFIGRAVVRRLLREGLGGSPVQVVALVRDARRLPDDVRDAVEAHSFDLAEASTDAIAAACGDHSTILHLAANASVAGGEAGYRNNVRATEHLIAAAHLSQSERLVYVSSIGAVDRAPPDDCSMPLDESSLPHPLTRYGAGKLAGERLIAESGLSYAIIRATWVYGPEMRTDSHLRVFVRMVRRGSLVTRFRFPGRVSVIHVDDLAAAVLLAAQHERAVGRVFFASDGVPISIGDLFALIGELTGRPAASVSIPGIVAEAARAWRRFLPLAAQNLHSDVLLASNARLVALGFSPSVPLRSGLIELARASGHGMHERWMVTGAASGIGRALSVQLHASGADVVAVDRASSGLASLAAECAGMRTVAADLADAGSRATVTAMLVDGGDWFEGLVNCAGIGARGTVATIATEAQRALLEVNVAALAELSTAALGRFSRRPEGGTLVNISSSAAVQPLPFMAAYAASKAFVLSYSEAIIGELDPAGPVRVIVVCPAGTDTGFQSASGVRRREGETLMPAHQVARIVLAAITAGRSRAVFIGSRTRAMALLARVLPRHVTVHLWARLMSQLR